MLNSFYAVVPGENQKRYEAHSSYNDRTADERRRPAEAVGYKTERLQKKPGTGKVSHGPLYDLTLSKARQKTGHGSLFAAEVTKEKWSLS